MDILGIFEHAQDPAACILRDGRIIAAAEEERFVRVKHAKGYFPIHSIQYCLREAGLEMKDVGGIGVGWDVNAYPLEMAEFFLRGWQKYPKDPKTLEWEIGQLRDNDPKTFLPRLTRKLVEHGFREQDIPPIHFFHHHYSHAITAHMCSGFERSAIITLDGHGERNCTVIWDARDGKLTKLREIDMPHSLGWYYAAFTVHGGFQAYDGEGQYMGLAPYGKPNRKYQDLVAEVLRVGDGSYELDPTWIFYGPRNISDRFTDKFVDAFGPPRPPGGTITPELRDVAYAAQERIEQAGLELARWAIRRTGATKLTMAGGVALNCKMNGRIWEETDLEDIFIQPVSGDDGGVAFGGAAALHLANGGDPAALKMEHVYLGPSFSDAEAREALERARVPYERADDVERVVARHLADGKVVGWFQGRMEYGPRALGSRSILGDPREDRMKDVLNAKVKFREGWRPFCPSILHERAHEYLVKPTFHPFMILAFTVKPEMRERVPAIVHVDGTARVQTVRKDLSPRYHALMTEFDRITGVPVLINTSFNVKGEPIVCRPDEAVAGFLKTQMDVLALGNYVATKG